MKVTILSIMTVLALATSGAQAKVATALDVTNEYPFDLNLGYAMHSFMIAFRKIMPCGVPELNLPVMAPLSIPHFAFDHSTKSLRVTGELSDVVVTGMNNFRILEANFNSTNQHMFYDIVYPEIQMYAKKMSKEWALVAGYPFEADFDGLVNVKLIDLRMITEYVIEENPKNPNGLRMEVFRMNLYLGDAIFNSWNNLWDISANNFMNKWLREFMLMGLEQIQPRIIDLYKKYVIPMTNASLDQVNMQELIEMYLSLAQQFNSADCNLSDN